ncbi:MAG: arginine--tRNA ligase [Ferruginibacter sp.]
MSMVNELRQAAIVALEALTGSVFAEKDIQINQTKPEFEGDYSIVLFGVAKKMQQSPEAIGNQLGSLLADKYPTLIARFQPIKGFLNITIQDARWIALTQQYSGDVCFGKGPMNGKKVMVEYASPNTNKPLHLGHLRNIFLGWSMAEILKANGYEVIKSSIVNDRGIHICKSMIAWQQFAQGATPESTGIKGDHLVGDYYVRFNDVLLEQVRAGMANGLDKEKAEKQAPIMLETQQMLLDWEAGDPDVLHLWRTMNSWVYEGFDKTYQSIGVDFDKTYYESDTYLLGKDLIQRGLERGVFYKKEDGSVWIDLTADGLDEKLVLRKDGTSVYITQDIGLAARKHTEFGMDESIYVIGDEQNYHMKVLKLIAQKLSLANADGIDHLSYGMVELPSGKMKSREGTVVDADDIVSEMIQTAGEHTEALGKVKDFSADELTALYKAIGLGAMKFYLLRVDPKKKMVFNPTESIDFHGFTGPFVQYTHARIQSILRKEAGTPFSEIPEQALLPLEKKVLFQLEQYPSVLRESCETRNPSLLAIFLFQLAQSFNALYAEHAIAHAENDAKKQLRLHAARFTATVLKSGLGLLGIAAPERM